MDWGGQFQANMGGPGAYQYHQHAQQAPYYGQVYQRPGAWPNAYPAQQQGQHDPYAPQQHQQQHQAYGHAPAGSAYPQAPAGGFVHPSHAQQYHQQRPQGMQVMQPLAPQAQHHAGQQWAAAGAAAYPAGGSSGRGYSSSGGGQMGLQPHSQPGSASLAHQQQQQQQYEHPGHRRTQQLVEQQQQPKQQHWQQYHQQQQQQQHWQQYHHQQQEGWQGSGGQGPQQGSSANHSPTAAAVPEPPAQQGQPDSAATPAPGEGYSDSPSTQQQEVPNRGSVLLVALQNQHGRGATDSSGHAASSSTAAADGGQMGLAAVQQGAAGGNSSNGASSSAQAQAQQPQGRVDPRGVYLVGLAPDITPSQLYEVFGAYGRVQNVAILSVKWHKTKCGFVNFEAEGGAGPAAVQKLVAQGVMDIGGYAVEVKPKVVKPKAAAAGDTSAQSAQQQQQQGAVQAGGAGSSKAAQNASNSSQSSSNSKLLGRNEEGLPMLRGAPCCPYYLGTGECKFRSNCRYHHPRHALHPECVAAGKKPHRYNAALMPSYARIYNHTERLWDYESCAEAQLKIWLARHLIACENSGCAMFDESAAVPAAAEYDTQPNDAQPLGPYSCTIAEADQVLQLLWKAQPDEASQQAMPYKGRVWHLLADDPYYELLPDPQGYANPNNSWVQLRLANIKGLLNY